MPSSLRAPVLTPGVATGIGSLPHSDPDAASRWCCAACPSCRRCRSSPVAIPREGLSRSGWVRCRRSRSARDGEIALTGSSTRSRRACSDPDDRMPGCSRSSTRSARDQPPTTREGADHRPAHARHRARRRRRRHRRVRSGARAAVGTRLGRRDRRRSSRHGSRVPACCCSSTSPHSCTGSAIEVRSNARRAIDIFSGALAAVGCVTGVHVCGRRRPRPRARGRARRSSVWRCATTSWHDAVPDRAVPRRRRLDRLGRGADRPPGRRVRRSALAAPRRVVVRADPARLRSRAVAHARDDHARVRPRRATVPPRPSVCSGSHGSSLPRVHDQAVAARLMLGA